MRCILSVFTCLFLVSYSFAADAPKRVLLVTHAGGFMHDSILTAEKVLKERGAKEGFELTTYRFTGDPDKKIAVKPRAGDFTLLEYEIRKPRGMKLNGNLALDMAQALKARVDPDGKRATRWWPMGDDRLSVEVPSAQVAEMKRLMKGAGVLEFQVLASGDMPPEQYRKYVDRLHADGPAVREGDEAKWLLVDQSPLGFQTEEHDKKRYVLGYVTPGPDGKPRSLTSHADKPWKINSASRLVEFNGESVINFRFDAQGAAYFGALTENNLNKPLAIVLDGKVLAAPMIRSKITANGVIMGGGKGFTDDEVDYLVRTLKAGSAPAALSDEPLSERAVVPKSEVTALEQYSATYQKIMGEPVTREQCGRVNAKTLKNFDAVIFFTTSTWKPDSGSHPLTEDELHDLIEWVNNGGAFVAVHCGSDTLHNTPYGDLLGGTFGGHPWLQKVRLHVEDPNHPAGKAFTDGAEILDEIYQFGKVSDRPKTPMTIQPYSREKLHIITSIDPTTIDLKIGARDDHDYASSWCHLVGKGRSFYTALGHHKAVWLDPRFQEHLLGGLKWAMGTLPGDATPSAELAKKGK